MIPRHYTNSISVFATIIYVHVHAFVHVCARVCVCVLYLCACAYLRVCVFCKYNKGNKQSPNKKNKM